MISELSYGALKRAALDGDPREGFLLAGQAAGMVNREQPAAEILKEITEQAEALLRGAAKWVG